MAISAPQNKRNPFYKLASRLIVLLGDEDGLPPSLENEVDWLIPTRIGVFANGGRDDVLTFRTDLSVLGDRLVDTTAPVGYHRQVEVRMLDEEGEPTIVLSWGFVSRQPQSIDSQNEVIGFEARLDNHVFGEPITDYPIYIPAPKPEDADKLQRVNRRMVFNPEIDEIIEPNCSSRTRKKGDLESDDATYDGDKEPEPWHYVVDPESLRTEAARKFQEQTASLWTLDKAVHFLCWQLNPDEEYIKNPHLEELTKVFEERNEVVKNIEIPFGCFLPAALDAILLPAEFGWHLVHELVDDEESEEDEPEKIRETRIRFFERGVGPDKKIYMQRPGEIKRLAKTNVTEFNATYSIVDLANQIHVFGDFVKTEATFRLEKGWDVEDDEIDFGDLEKDQPTAIEKPFVGRKWVLNEAGDYIGRRPEVTEPYDLSEWFGPLGPRRRKFEKCLSEHSAKDDSESNRFRVDWYDEDAEDASDPENVDDPGWTKVTWPFSVLEKECGILFEGPTPPDALWALIQDGKPEKALVRITATISGDERISSLAARRDESPNGLKLTQVIDLKTKFQDSNVALGTVFAVDDKYTSIARNDRLEIEDYAVQVRNIEDAAQISCSMVLEGIDHPSYEIGDLIGRVEGRNLDLNGYSTAPGSGVKPRRPQIMGFNYHIDGEQRLELLLESFKQEKPRLTTHKKH